MYAKKIDFRQVLRRQNYEKNNLLSLKPSVSQINDLLHMKNWHDIIIFVRIASAKSLLFLVLTIIKKYCVYCYAKLCYDKKLASID